jgi:Family of unknown function (DUF6325)
MSDINVDELGPVDYLVVGFPAEEADFSGEMASELKRLVDNGTIRILDLVVVAKGEDGAVEAAELRDHDDSELGELRGLERDLAILLAEEDIEEIGASLEPGSAAAVLVWENSCGTSARACFPRAIRSPTARWEMAAVGACPEVVVIARRGSPTRRSHHPMRVSRGRIVRSG